MTMLQRSGHCLLALLMLLQSVSAAWAQVQVISTPPTATQAMQPGEHCARMAVKAINATKSQANVISKSKTDCPCCEKQCVPMHCAVHLQVVLPLFNVSVPFAPTTFTSSQFSQVADTYYLRPPTPPPNAL